MGEHAQRRAVGILIAGLVALALRAPAQVQVGDDVSLNLSGSIAAGYSGNNGDVTPSGHGLGFGGNADLSGYYYNPNFLSFHIAPYLNDSHQSTGIQSVTDTTGVRASANIFGGSHTPGWVNFNWDYNSTSNYAIPGVGNYLAHGNSQSLGIGWSETFPNWPNVSFSYQQGGSDYSVFGANTETQAHYRSFNETSSYLLKGFHFTENFHYGTNETDYPRVFVGAAERSDSNNDSIGLGVSHDLPVHGYASGHFDRSAYEFTSGAATSTGTIDSLDGHVGLNPSQKVSVGVDTFYTDNLTGTIYQTLFNTTGITPLTGFTQSNSSMSLTGNVVYSVTNSLRLIARESHRSQFYQNNNYSSDSLGGVVTWFHMLGEGRFNVSGSVAENTVSFNGQNTLGVSGSASYSRSIGAWNLMGQAGYSQNQETLLVTYTSSVYNFGGTVGRRLGRKMYWNGSANMSKSMLDNQANSGFASQNYSTAFSLPRIGFSASYSHSSGTAIAGATGLTLSPIPLPIVPVPVTMYGGDSYSFGAGGSPMRGLTFSASYVRALSNTFSNQVGSTNKTDLGNVYFQYRFRKMYINGGYTRLLQGFSGEGAPAGRVNSFYIGVSRWFKFF